MSESTEAALLLQQLAGPTATLRDAQLQAIDAVVGQRRRTLVVQRTGFGKSAVYFIATKLLRDRGAGPALVVSPLLALMRDQVAAAERMGVRSATINSTNLDEWADIERALAADELDLLCISPERLNHPRFAREILPKLAAGLGLLVIDEAHCISDWGHDFRPDYRRIRDAIANLDPQTPVIATTATANERVSHDIADQLGDDVLVLRGTLDRESLALGVAHLQSQAERLAWIAQRIPQTEGTGIVYCLTVDQTQQVAEFLQSEGIDARAYSGKTPPEERLPLEADFKANRLKVLVATSALGMGVDKADVTFVFHLGAPPSPIAYYQQVGRAGRAVDHAQGWLLPGPEDQAIWEYFTSVGLPPQRLVDRVLSAMSDVPVSVVALERQVDLKRTRLETLLKILDVEGAVERLSEGWVLSGRPWTYDAERVERVAQARRDEAQQMLTYATQTQCLMRFLREALDDEAAIDCGRCSVCRGTTEPEPIDPATVLRAVQFLRGADVDIDPRRQWPRGNDASMPKGNLKADVRAEPGKALCRVNDAGWWPVVEACSADGAITDELLGGVFDVLKRWQWTQRPTWVTWIDGDGPLAAPLAQRIASAGKMQLAPTLQRSADAVNGGSASNSVFRATDVWHSLTLVGEPPSVAGPGLLVLDEVDSRWTQTIAAYLLRSAGSGPILPFALTLR